MPGTMLMDEEIANEIEKGRLKISGLNQTPARKVSLTKDSSIQPSSLDLHIGRIFEPPDHKVDIARNFFPQMQTQNTPKGIRLVQAKALWWRLKNLSN